jgi:FkbM family methyltransferase
MTLRSSLRKFLEKNLTLKIFNERYLPLGISLETDLRMFGSKDFRVVFDVGANIGQTAERFIKSFENADIYCFEPIKRPFEILKMSFQDKVRVHCYNSAFGSEIGQQTIIINDDPLSTTNSLIHQGRHAKKDTNREVIEVDTIDLFLSRNQLSGIDFLKVDVEGFELEVLKGAERSLRERRIKVLLCEVGLSEENKFHISLARVLTYMEGFDYYFFGLYETELVRVDNGRVHSNALFVLKNDLFSI